MTISTFIASNPHIDLRYVHTRGDERLMLDTRILRDKLEDVPLNHPSVVQWMREYLMFT